jgi:hypothetical protein
MSPCRHSQDLFELPWGRGLVRWQEPVKTDEEVAQDVDVLAHCCVDPTRWKTVVDADLNLPGLEFGPAGVAAKPAGKCIILALEQDAVPVLGELLANGMAFATRADARVTHPQKTQIGLRGRHWSVFFCPVVVVAGPVVRRAK